MNYTILMGNSEPATTRAIFGSTIDGKSFNLDLDNTTIEKKKICSDLFNLIGGHVTINILNSPYEFSDINYVVVSGVDLEIIDINYTILSNEDRKIINEFSNLLIEISL